MLKYVSAQHLEESKKKEGIPTDAQVNIDYGGHRGIGRTVKSCAFFSIYGTHRGDLSPMKARSIQEGPTCLFPEGSGSNLFVPKQGSHTELPSTVPNRGTFSAASAAASTSASAAAAASTPASEPTTSGPLRQAQRQRQRQPQCPAKLCTRETSLLNNSTGHFSVGNLARDQVSIEQLPI